MDIAALTDEELNALHREVMSEWGRRNTPTDEDLERMTNGTDELLHSLAAQVERAI